MFEEQKQSFNLIFDENKKGNYIQNHNDKYQQMGWSSNYKFDDPSMIKMQQ